MNKIINIKHYKLAYYMCICNATQRKPQLYILTNNYFKFIFQKIFFAMRCLTLCAFGSGVNLVKSFLTLIKFNFNRIFKIYYKEI